MNALTDALLFQVRAVDLPEPCAEWLFWPKRKFRFDFAWPNEIPPLAVECDGGTWVGGRHTSGTGFETDCVKLNEATLRGWRVLRFTGGMIERGEAIAALLRAFGRSD